MTFYICLIIDIGAPPTVDTKYEFVHNVGSLDFNHENSSRSILEDIPFIRLTTLCIPNCGSTLKANEHGLALLPSRLNRREAPDKYY